MDYEDQVLISLKKLKPDTRINLENLKDPERFKDAVIYLIDFGAIDSNEYEFNRNYTVLKKHEPIDFRRFQTRNISKNQQTQKL